MLEGLASRLLNFYLGTFLDDVTWGQLNIGLLSGHIVLENVFLKEDAFEKMEIPLRIKHGFIGRLVIKIPWSSFLGSPVQVSINEVYLVACPIFDRTYDPELEERLAYEAKMRKLKEFQQGKGRSASGFFSRLSSMLFNELQIDIGRVHLRFEDALSNPRAPFAIGATSEGLSLYSSDWQEGFVDDPKGIIYKIGTLDSLAIYLETHTTLMGNRSRAEFIQEAPKRICHQKNPLVNEAQYLLKPATAEVKVRMDYGLKSGLIAPWLSIYLDAKEIGVMLDDAQYRVLVQPLDLITHYTMKEKFRKFRPPIGVTPMISPRAWWQFAIRTTLSEIEKKKQNWIWSSLALRREDRKAYVAAFKKVARSKNVEAQGEIDELERFLSLNDILLYRGLAQAELEREQPGLPSSWSLRGWFKGPPVQESISVSTVGLTEDEKEGLFRAMNFKEPVPEVSETLPSPEADQVLVSLTFGKISAHVRRFAKESTLDVPAFSPLVTLDLTEANLDFKKRHQSFDLFSTISKLELADVSSARTKYPILVQTLPTDEESPVVAWTFKKNVLDGHADDAFDLLVAPMEIFANHEVLTKVAKFFIPKDKETTLEVIAESAAKGVVIATNGRRILLQRTLEIHRSLDIKFHIATPTIFLPCDSIDPENNLCLLVKAESFVMKNIPLSKAERQKLENWEGKPITKEEEQELRDQIYEKYEFELSSMQIILGHSVETLRKQSTIMDIRKSHLLAPTSMSFAVWKCFLQGAMNLTDLMVFLKLPDVTLQLSDQKLSHILLLADAVGNSLKTLNEAEKNQIEIFLSYIKEQLFSSPFFTDDPYTRNLASRLLAAESGEEKPNVKNISKANEVQLSPEDLQMLLDDIQVQAVVALNNFEIHFENERLILPQTKLFSLFLSDINMTYTLRSFDVKVITSLGGLFLRNWTSDNRKLIVSDQSPAVPFLALEYAWVDAISPEFTSMYHMVNQNLTINVQKLLTFLDPGSLIHLTTSLQLIGGQLANELAGITGALKEEPEGDTKKLARPVKDLPDFRMRLNLNDLTIQMMLENAAETKVHVNGSQTTFALGSTLGISSSIENLSLTATPLGNQDKRVLFPHLLETASSTFATFAFTSYTRDAPNYPGYDWHVQAKVNATNLIYIPDSVEEILTFFNRVSEVQENLRPAKEAVKRRLNLVRKKLPWQEEISKVSVDITLLQPQLAIVSSRYTPECLIIDVNDVKFHNRFYGVGRGASEIDEISTLISVFRVSLLKQPGEIFVGSDSRKSNVKERLINDLDAHLCIKRNLNEEYKGAPVVEIVGGITCIEFFVSTSRVIHLLPLLSVIGFQAQINQDVPVEKKPMKYPHEETSKYADVTLGVQGIKFSLERELITQSQDVEPLAVFEFEDVSAKIVSMTDTAFDMEFVTPRLGSEDLRPSTTNTFLKPLETKEICLTMSTKPNEDLTSMAVTIPDINLYMILDFWLEVYNVLQLPVASGREGSRVTTEIQESKGVKSEGKFNLELLVVRPLMYCPSNPRDRMCDGAFVELEAFSVVSKGNVTDITTKRLQAFSCKMDEIAKTFYPITQPVDLLFSSTTDASSQDIKAEITRVFVLLTYRDVKLLTSIIDYVSAAIWTSPVLVSPADVSEVGQNQFAITMMDVKPPESEEKEAQAAEPPEELIEASSSSSPPPKQQAQRIYPTPPKTEVLYVKVGDVNITLVNNMENSNSPLFQLIAKSPDIVAKNWSSILSVQSGLELEAQSFNPRLSVWESLIEPWEASFLVKRETTTSPLDIEVHSAKILNTTLCYSAMKLAQETFFGWMTDLRATGTNRVTREIFAPFVVHNNLGIPFSFACTNAAHPTLISLEPGEQVEWNPYGEDLLDYSSMPSNGLSLVFGNNQFNKIDDLPFDRIGQHFASLSPLFQGHHYRIVCDVTWKKGKKYVSIRSSMLLKNMTTIPFEIRATATQTPWETKTLSEVVPPQEVRCVPLPLCFHGEFSLRPKLEQTGLEMNWSAPQTWKTMTGLEDANFTTLPVLAQDQQAFVFRVVTQSHKEETQFPQDITMKIMPPLVIRNLLPLPVSLWLEDRKHKKLNPSLLKCGQELELFSAPLSEKDCLMGVSIPDLGYETSGSFHVSSKLLNLTHPGGEAPLVLHAMQDEATQERPRKVSIYSQFVFVDRSHLDLAFRKISGKKGGQGEPSLKAHKVGQIPLSLFSLPKVEAKEVKAALQAKGTAWSVPFVIDAAGSTGQLDLESTETPLRYQLGVHVKLGDGVFSPSKVIQISPRYAMTNEAGCEMLIRQSSTKGEMLEDPFELKLQPEQTAPFHFQRGDPESTAVQISFTKGQTWSPPFRINEVEEFELKVEDNLESANKFGIARASVKVVEASLFVTFSKHRGASSYRVDNFAFADFVVYENEMENLPINIPARAKVPFLWTVPDALKKTLLVSIGSQKMLVNMKKLGQTYRVYHSTAEGDRALDLQVRLESSVTVLAIMDTTVEEIGYPALQALQPKGTEVTVTTERSQLNEAGVAPPAPQNVTRVGVKLAGFGLSLVDQEPQEFLYLSVRDLDFAFSDSSVDQTMVLQMKNFQMDNQLDDPEFVVVLCRTPLPPSSLARQVEEGKKPPENDDTRPSGSAREETETLEIAEKPILHASYRRVKGQEGVIGPLYFQYFSLLLQEIDLDLSESVIVHLIQFAQVFVDTSSEQQSRQITETDVANQFVTEAPKAEPAMQVFFGLFEIQPVKVNLTFVRAKDEVLLNSTGVHVLRTMLDILSNGIGGIEEAPIELNALELRDLLADTNIILASLILHYKKQAISQLHHIVGSIEILGNPVGLFNDVSSGFQDFFYDPQQGIERVPSDFSKGLEGTASVIKSTMGGMFNATTDITGSIAKGLAHASLDKNFQAKRRARRREPCRNTWNGLISGFATIGMGIADGVSGVFTMPMEGKRKRGTVGIFTGLGKGLVGLIAKPASGGYDGVTQMIEGVGNDLTQFDMQEIRQVRLARSLALNGAVTPFDARASFGQSLIRRLTEKHPKYEDLRYIDMVQLSHQNAILLVTQKLIFLLKLKPHFSVEWKEKLVDLRVMNLEGSDLKMVFTHQRKSVQTHQLVNPDPELIPALQETLTEAARVATQGEKIITIRG